MNKIYDKIVWHNGTTPALNEDNLNAMSEALDGIDDRVVDLAGTIMEDVPQIQAYLDQAEDLVEAMELLSKNPPYIGANGNWYVWDTNTDAYVDSGIDASITVQIADVTMLAEGASPYITNTGTNTDPIFHLFIPIGATGATGPQGPRGNTIIETTCDWAVIVDPVPIGNFVPAYMVNQSVVLQYAINVNVTSVEIGDYIIWMNGPRLSYVGNKGSGADPYIYIDEGITIKGAAGARGATGATGPQGPTGADGFSPAVTITTITGGHRVNITDASHPSGQNFDVMDGTGSGDMLSSVYDGTGAVATAGGIVAYINDTVAAALTASY